MKQVIMLSVALGVLGSLCAGCAQTYNVPLVFGQTQDVGIVVAGSAADQGAKFTLGYSDRNIAVMPVTMCKQKVVEVNGKQTVICDDVPGLVSSAGERQDGKIDALSVIGQFSVESDSSDGGTAPASVKVGLGKFFATGVAAQSLADGFRCALANEGNARAVNCPQVSAGAGQGQVDNQGKVDDDGGAAN